MNRLKLVVLITGIAALSFLAGNRFQRKSSAEAASSHGRRILYYIDPMHPAYKSDRPGVAPDCGMALEPVYADGVSAGTAEPTIPGAVNITSEKQQMMGIRLEEVKSSGSTQRVRLLGRVAADERRVYFLNAATDGWIQNTFSNSTGSLVKKDEVLATCYAPEFLPAEQAYFYALSALDRFKASGRETSDQIAITQVSVKQAADGLRNLGMGEVQIQALAHDRRITENIEIRSPATGFILERNVSTGLRFERGKQLYRIADLNRVWVLADLFENEAFLKPDQGATVKYQGRTWRARLSDILPRFDPSTRTLKVRFELDNPGYALRPDMFVDVDLEANLPPTLYVPVEAILDSGAHKTVYVDRGNGFFEPKQVETGRRLADRVQILKGLEAGERIVVSGNFLVDSESRMKLSAARAARMPANTAGRTEKDPVCNMDVDPKNPKALNTQHGGKTYYFCSEHCKRTFQEKAEKYLPKLRGAEKPRQSARVEPAAREKT